MQLIARWTNLSETTFILPVTTPGADYRVRIFTPAAELPFAGHPTLGTAHAWLTHSGGDDGRRELVQECSAGLIRLRRREQRWSFAAPPLLRYQPVDPDDLARLAQQGGVDPGSVVAGQWVDNGPGWAALLLNRAEAVLAARPAPEDGLKLGLVGPYPEGCETAYELRAFYMAGGTGFEDPVTGSLNASVAHWLYERGDVTGPYVASQGTVINRAGRVFVERDDGGRIWVGGSTVTCLSGEIAL